MKKILLISTVMLFILGCEKAEEAIKYKMTATVGGAEWKTRLPVAKIESGNFIIIGTNTEGRIIEITVFGTTSGTYELNPISIPPKAECSGLYKLSASSSHDDVYAATSGTVVLTEVNTSSKKISGTFAFSDMLRGTSLETINITNGVLTDVPYTEE